MPSTHPYYRRRAPGKYHAIRNHSDGTHVALGFLHLPPYGDLNTIDEAVRRFDARTAEFVRSSTGKVKKIVVFPDPDDPNTPSLLALESYNSGDINVPSRRCLAALAYLEFFPYDKSAKRLGPLVSEAILGAQPGYCGSFGSPPASTDYFILISDLVDASDSGQGNYDLSQMHLLQIAYRYYDFLTEDAQDRLINVLLATGRIHRPGQDDIVTSGRVPNDWGRAGHIPFLTRILRIGDTENHILQIHTARYLTNQLLYQRDRSDILLSPGEEHAEIVASARQSFWFQSQWLPGATRSRWSVEMREGRPQITLLRAVVTPP